MSRPPDPSTNGQSGYASAEAAAGLAREVEELRRTFAPLVGLPGRVDDLARVVAELVETVTALSARPTRAPAPSWLMLPADDGAVGQVLGELCAWLHAVYLRYPDAAVGLTECWLYHPDVVEELVWLMHAWCVAYQGAGASVALAADWHDRQRPGVVRRITAQSRACSWDKHRTRPDWNQSVTGAMPVPGVEDVEPIAAWWAGRRDDPAPEPDPARQPLLSRRGR